MRIPADVNRLFRNNKQSRIIIKVNQDHPDRIHIEDILGSIKSKIPNVELKMI